MKEHPIIFNGEMVRAVLDGNKTQTRRVVTHQNALIDGTRSRLRFTLLNLSDAWVDKGPSPAGNPGPYLKAPTIHNRKEERTIHRLYPQWQVGDRLWGRETFWQPRYDDGQWCSGGLHRYDADRDKDDPAENWKDEWTPNGRYKKRPSIFMPRYMSRIDLEVTGMRVERVQEITHEHAIAEGAALVENTKNLWHYAPHVEHRACSAIIPFSFLWDSINKKRGFGWNVNPWVWTITFKVVK